MNNKVLKQGHHQHPLWMIISFAKSIKDFVIPVGLYVVVHVGMGSSTIKWGALAIGLFVLYRLFSVFLSWWNYRYLLTDKDLIIVEGRFVKEERFIALERIQSVQLKRSPFHRLLGLAFLSFNTAAAGDESSVVLEAITLKEAERIQKHLREVKLNSNQNDEAEEVKIASPTQPDRKKHYKITGREIVLASLTSFKPLALIPILLALYSRIDDFFSIDNYIDKAVTVLEMSWVIILIILIIVLAISVVFGIVTTYLRYGHFCVTSDDERIFIQKGVFSQSEFSIPKEKVQAVTLKKNVLRRWLGFVQVDLVSAGGVGVDTIEIASSLFPFIHEKKARKLIPEILPNFKVEKDMVKLGRVALFVKLIKPLTFWAVVSAIFIYYFPGYWYAPFGLLAVIFLIYGLSYLHSAYLLNGEYVQLLTGIFTTELFVTKRKKIEELEIKETWLRRRFGLAKLIISTRAKPIRVADISDIPKNTAFHYYHWYAGWKKN